MEHSISVKQVLIDLISIIPQVVELFGENEKYKPLVDYLSAKDYYNDYDIPYPNFKGT